MKISTTIIKSLAFVALVFTSSQTMAQSGTPTIDGVSFEQDEGVDYNNLPEYQTCYSVVMKFEQGKTYEIAGASEIASNDWYYNPDWFDRIDDTHFKFRGCTQYYRLRAVFDGTIPNHSDCSITYSNFFQMFPVNQTDEQTGDEHPAILVGDFPAELAAFIQGRGIHKPGIDGIASECSTFYWNGMRSAFSNAMTPVQDNDEATIMEMTLTEGVDVLFSRLLIKVCCNVWASAFLPVEPSEANLLNVQLEGENNILEIDESGNCRLSKLVDAPEFGDVYKLRLNVTPYVKYRRAIFYEEGETDYPTDYCKLSCEKYDSVDGIKSIDNGRLTNDNYYDLQGRKIENGQLSKGIFIHEGKKIVR